MAYNFIKKETLAHVFFCEFWKVLKTAYYEENLGPAASDNSDWKDVCQDKSICQKMITVFWRVMIRLKIVCNYDKL